jgi:hypothetical protein
VWPGHRARLRVSARGAADTRAIGWNHKLWC